MMGWNLCIKLPEKAIKKAHLKSDLPVHDSQKFFCIRLYQVADRVRLKPARPTNAEAKSQTAAGMGTAEITP